MSMSRSTGSSLAIAGAVLALVGNLLAPRFTQDDDVAIYRAVAASDRLTVANLVLILAFLVSTAGIYAVASSMRGGAGNDAAVLGGAVVTIGGAIGLAQMGIEAFAYRQLAKTFVSADDTNRPGAFWATNAVDHVNAGLLSTWTILFLGVAPVLIAAAMMRSRAFPAWLAAMGALGGICCIVVGVHNLVSEEQTALDVLFLVGSLLVTAWLLVAGVLLRRAPVDAA